MSQINQRQVQKLLQKLSPQQIQMIKLLELPSMQLEQRIKQELEDNPVIEENVTEDEKEEQQPKEISVEEYLAEDETPSYKYHANNYSKDDPIHTPFISGTMSFQDYLIEQLGFRSLSEREQTIAEYIIGSIDDDGYLRRELISVADDIAFSLSLEVSEEELLRILRIIQTLEPSGVGARTLKECLLLQIDSKLHLNANQRVARKIIASYFEEFSKKHYEKLMSKLSISEQQFRDAIEEIVKLSPKPGHLYNEDANDNLPYITPDFILDYQNGKFELSLNSANIPDIKINRRYVEMIRQLTSVSGSDVSESDKEALQFVKNKIDSAKWFISAIKQRHDTLTHTMQAIFEYQKEYFVDGDQSKLRPMILKDIADVTKLDVSTISRVVNSKYVQTHFGILSLKHLFSEAMQTDSGEEVSSYEIKKIISECIENENKRRPLTDEALMEILNDRGYRIARRTVAKYREMLATPVARLRKKI